jgi:hypothetical protein
MRRTSYSGLFGLVSLALGACGSTPADTNDAAMSMGDAGPPDSGMPMTCAPVAPTCVDEQISMLDLFSTVSTRIVEEESADPGTHVSHIDSMAGGVSPSESYVYARFTDAGLVRVDISDQDAFASTEWDIAFRRFIIRLNSGVSGPSCVQAARLPNDPGTGGPPAFDSVTSVPGGLAFHSEVYMTASCSIVPDESGLMSPATVLSSFWTYPGCVSMSHNVYILTLADGRNVKLEVVGYYNPTDQANCDATGAMPTTTGSSGNIRIHWAYL